MPLVLIKGLLSDLSTESLLLLLAKRNEYFFTKNGRLYSLADLYADINCESGFSAPIVVSQRLIGGKGGFGSMLRSMGSKMYKNRNKDACRGLDGRRLRDSTIEKKIKEHNEKEKVAHKKQQPSKTQKEISKLERYVTQSKGTNSSEDVKNAETYMENLKKSSNFISESVRSNIKHKSTGSNLALRDHVGKTTRSNADKSAEAHDEAIIETSECSSVSNLSLSVENDEIY